MSDMDEKDAITARPPKTGVLPTKNNTDVELLILSSNYTAL